jgi:hypothetical protein
MCSATCGQGTVLEPNRFTDDGSDGDDVTAMLLLLLAQDNVANAASRAPHTVDLVQQRGRRDGGHLSTLFGDYRATLPAGVQLPSVWTPVLVRAKLVELMLVTVHDVVAFLCRCDDGNVQSRLLTFRWRHSGAHDYRTVSLAGMIPSVR